MSRFRMLGTAVALVGAGFLTAGSVTYYDESLPTTMNPLFARSMVDYRVHELVFDRLFYRHPITNDLKSRLVSRFQRHDDRNALQLWFAEGVKWHDGTAFSGADVCFTVDVLLNPNTPSRMAKAYREAIEGCTFDAKDGSATVTFKRFYAEPRERMGFSILPKHAFDTSNISPDMAFSSRPVGTGAMAGARGRQAVTFGAYPNGHQKAKVKELVLNEAGDEYVAVKTLLNGRVHGIVAVAPPMRPEVAASDDVSLKSYDLRSWWYVALNTNKGALTDKRVRQALDLTIDRNELRTLTVGVDPEDQNPSCEFISGPFVPSSPYYNKRIAPAETKNLAKAKQLLTAAGASQSAGRWTWQGKPITLKIGMHSVLDKEAKDLLNQIGNQLQAGGFDRQVHNVSSDDWNRKALTGQLADYDLLIGKWSFGLVEDVNPIFHTRLRGKGSLNVLGYSNPKVDQVLAAFEDAKTDTAARDAYHELHATLAEDLPYLFLWKLDTKSAWRNEVRNNIIAPYFYFTAFDGWTFDG